MPGWLGIVMVISAIVCFVTLLDSIITDSSIEFAICVISMIICISTVILACVGSAKLEKQSWVVAEEPYATHSIVALNDSNQINGKFYCRRGYIEEKLYYQYMRKSGSGFKAGKVKADDTILYYTDDDYRVEFYMKTKEWWIFHDEAYYYEIYIPEGSITEDYQIDLQ